MGLGEWACGSHSLWGQLRLGSRARAYGAKIRSVGKPQRTGVGNGRDTPALAGVTSGGCKPRPGGAMPPGAGLRMGDKQVQARDGQRESARLEPWPHLPRAEESEVLCVPWSKHQGRGQGSNPHPAGAPVCPAPGLVSESAAFSPPADWLPTSSFPSCPSGTIASVCRAGSDAQGGKGQCDGEEGSVTVRLFQTSGTSHCPAAGKTSSEKVLRPPWTTAVGRPLP